MPVEVTCDVPVQVTCTRNTAPPNTYRIVMLAEGVTITFTTVPLAQLEVIAANLNPPQGQAQGQPPSTGFKQWLANQPGDTGTPPGDS